MQHLCNTCQWFAELANRLEMAIASTTKQPYNIILLGELGVGKTTLFSYLSGGSSGVSASPDQWLATHPVTLEGQGDAQDVKVRQIVYLYFDIIIIKLLYF